MAIDPIIKQKADDIRHKIYGKEVRESLASGIEAMSEDVEATIGRQDYVEEQFQNVIDETTDKDVISAPELIAARNGKSNLKTRLDDEHAQVTAQLEQIVNINPLDFGAINDGVTDNSHTYTLIRNFILEHESNNFHIAFSRGTYYSTKPLQIDCENLIISGDNATLIRESETSEEYNQVVIYVENTVSFDCYGLTLDNRIKNKSYVKQSVEGGTYYHIRCTVPAIASQNMKGSNIYNNVFIDNISVPNATGKTYNGGIWFANARNINIFNNQFVNSCGRIIYTGNCDNVNVFDNTIENFGYIHSDVTNAVSGTLLVRPISSRNVSIYNNRFIGTKSYHPKQTPSYGIALVESEWELPCENVSVHNNIFETNETQMEVFHLRNLLGAVIENNHIILNNVNPSVKPKFMRITSDSPRDIIKNTEIKNNRVDGATNQPINVLMTPENHKIVRIHFQDNTFNSQSDTIVRLFNAPNNDSFSMFGNKVLVNNQYKYEVGLWTIDYNTTPTISTTVSLDDVSEGVIDLPINSQFVTNSNSEEITIKDITFDGKYLPNKQVTFLNTGAGNLIFEHAQSTLRLPKATSITLGFFESLTLKYVINRWYVIS